MYKILHNNQIIDVMEDVRYVKCLPKSQKLIAVDKAQANGIVSSDGDTIYHILGTKNTFDTEKETVKNKNLIVHSNIPHNYTKIEDFKTFKPIFV